MSRLVSALVLAAVALAPAVASAHEINFGSVGRSKPNMLYAKTGVDSGFTASAGYARAFRARDRHLILSLDFTMPYLRPDFGDRKARLGFQAPLVQGRGFALVARVAPTVRRVSTSMNSMTSLGADFSLVGGYYRRRWFVAAELGVDWSAATRIEHTKLYRDAVYADVKDGWYGNTGGNFYYGLLGGYSFAPVDLVLRVGQARDLAKGRTAFLPMYATFGINVRFGDAKGRRARTRKE